MRSYDELSAEIVERLEERKQLMQKITAAEEAKKLLCRELSNLDHTIGVLYQERAGQQRLF